jgi:RHS repeat-associated protein
MKTNFILFIQKIKWFLSIFLFLSINLGYSQVQPTASENFIYVIEPKEPTLIVNNTTDSNRVIQYYDGLGRPMQTIQSQSTSNNKDIVTKYEYDEFSRPLKDFLPAPTSQNNGKFIPNADSFYNDYYGTGSEFNTEFYYSQKELESSPLNRLLKQAAPGDDWKLGSGHEIEFDYLTNKLSDGVQHYRVSLSPDFIPTIYNLGNYAENLLYKTVTTDENNHTIEEFTTKLGKLVLKRTFEGVNVLDTYYLYDSYSNLTFVIPPLASSKPSITQHVLDKLCYQYIYNEKNLLIEKKLPDKGWEYMVYDKQDRLVAMQDSILRNNNNWLFTKYDKFGRVVYTGLTSGSIGNIRSNVNNAANNNNEYPDNKNGFLKNGLFVKYSKEAFPTSFSEIYNVNYYDEYLLLGVEIPPLIGVINDEPISSQNKVNTRGMLTSSMVRVLNTNDWEKNYYFYDSKLRVLRAEKENHLGGKTIVDNEYNFRGLITKSTITHKRKIDAPLITVEDNFTYTTQEQLLTHTQKVNQNPIERIANNQFDELGQLIRKNVGGLANNSALQEVDYSYNIRGWLTNINDVSKLNKPNAPLDLFAFKINYNDPVSGHFNSSNSEVEPLYNGNISETFWRTASDNILRGYGYSYDQINRLKNAYYQKPNATVPLPHTYDEYLKYDLNGNITELKRFSGSDTPIGAQLTDDLDYIYFTDSNQLKSVTDATNSTVGFGDGNTNGDDYVYDANGNLTKDRNKGIENISYNHLNLPTEILWSSSKKIQYLYNASGQKVQKKVTNGTSIKITDYLDGFQYNQQLLEFFPHSEGYVKVTAMGLTPNNPNYAFNYVYNYTDHLGNIRVSYTKDPQTGLLKILDESHYYPFGLRHQKYSNYGFIDQNSQVIIAPIANNPYQYKYNGKELQDELGLDWYDYGARFYMPDIGRWGVHDPAAEYMVEWSPYNYAYNDPMSFVDQDGEMPGPTGFVLGVLSDYIGQVGYNYFYNGWNLRTSMTTGINYWSLGISGLSGAATGGISAIKNVVSSGVGKKVFVGMIDYGVDVLVNTVENAMSDQLNEGNYDFWKSLTGGLIEAGIGKVIPMKYVDKLEQKLLRETSSKANYMNRINKKLNKAKNKGDKKRERKLNAKHEEAKAQHNSYNKAYQGVKIVNDAYKAGGVNALTDSLFKKEDKPKGTLSTGELEVIGIE